MANEYTKDDLERLQELIDKNTKMLEEQGRSAQNVAQVKKRIAKYEKEIANIQKDQISLGERIGDLSGGILESLEEQIGLTDQSVKTTEVLQQALETGNKKTIEGGNNYAALLADITSGSKTTSEILGDIASNSANFGPFQENVDKLRQSLVKQPDLTKKFKLKKEVLDSIDGMAGGFIKAGKAIKAATGFIGIISAVLLAALKYVVGFAKQTLEVRRNLGLSVVDATKLSFHMEKSAVQAKLLGGDSEKAKTLVKELAMEFGTVGEATSLSSTNIAQLTTHLGIGGSETAKLLKAFSDVSGETLNNLSNQLEFEASLTKSAGIPVAKVMGQVASNTALFARYGADGANQLFRAARAAADLGTSLDVVEGVADSILDLETSIAAELEAEMLIGRDINLDRARQLAQANDLEGLQQEIVNQVGGPEAFANLGRIEQGALASAFGLSVEQIKPFLSGEKTGVVGDPQTAAIQQMNKDLKIAIGDLTAAVNNTGGETARQFQKAQSGAPS